MLERMDGVKNKMNKMLDTYNGCRLLSEVQQTLGSFPHSRAPDRIDDGCTMVCMKPSASELRLINMEIAWM
jgi:hypothetical protein